MPDQDKNMILRTHRQSDVSRGKLAPLKGAFKLPPNELRVSQESDSILYLSQT